MKIETKKIDSTKRELAVEVSGDVVKKKFEEVFEKLAKEAKAPGFRAGKVPRDILEKNFSSQAHEMVIRELIPDTYNEAVNKEGLDVIGMPDISDVKVDHAMLSFKATVEVSPEIKLGEYKGIRIDYKKVEVGPDEIKRALDSLKESRKIDNLDDGLARSLGYPSVAEMESTLEKQIFVQKANAQQQKIESGVVEAVTKGADFKLPRSLVERQLQDLTRQAKMDLAIKGASREQIAQQEKEIAKHLEPEAEKQVRIYLVLAEIAKKENIPVDDHMPHKVVEFLLKEGKWEGTA